jgi:hypothetical protein
MLDESIALPRSSKPLCLDRISSMVLSVLKTHESLTFQGVADSILSTMSGEPMDASKARTLRRRIYDVLNVFLAARLISKDGKNIIWGLNPNPALSSLIETVRMKQIQLVDKITIFVNWKLVMERNMTRPKPAVTVPVWRTLFVGFTPCQGRSSNHSIDRQTIEIWTASTPTFFSPLEVIATFKFTDAQKLAILQQIPSLRQVIPYIFPDVPVTKIE